MRSTSRTPAACPKPSCEPSCGIPCAELGEPTRSLGGNGIDRHAVENVLRWLDETWISDGAMTRRSRAREVALQLLFQRDHNPGVDRAVIEHFIQERLRDPALQPFCTRLYDGVVSHVTEI